MSSEKSIFLFSTVIVGSILIRLFKGECSKCCSQSKCCNAASQKEKAAPTNQMDAETIAIIKATAPAVAPKALEITRLFYKTLFTNCPEAAQFFNKANQVSVSNAVINDAELSISAGN